MNPLFQALSQTWPARAVQGLYEAAKHPGEVYAGRADPMDVEKATDLAGLAMTGGLGGLGGMKVAQPGLRQLTPEEALRLVAGRTEKDGGVDPAKFIEAALGNKKEFYHGRIPLSSFVDNEAGALYDGTVNPARAAEYAARKGDFPPVIASDRKGTGTYRIQDGGHRLTAARMRGDKDIAAILTVLRKYGLVGGMGGLGGYQAMQEPRT